MNKGIFNLLVFSLIVGMGGYFVKMLVGVSSQQIMLIRAILAVILLFGVAVFTGKVKELKLKYPFGTILMGVVEGLSLFFYYRALTMTTIANTTLLVYIAPVFSVILSAIFLKEKIEKKTMLGILVSMIGVVIVSDPSKFSLSPAHMWGSIYALLGGFFYSAMAISSKSVAEKTTPLYTTFWKYLVIIVMSLPFALPLQANNLTTNIFPLLYLGWGGAIAFLLYMRGITLVKGQIIQVVTMLEIVVASLSGMILLGETMSLQTIVGGLCIVAGIFVVSKK